jgi:hypothetical protein
MIGWSGGGWYPSRRANDVSAVWIGARGPSVGTDPSAAVALRRGTQAAVRLEAAAVPRPVPEPSVGWARPSRNPPPTPGGES